MDIHTKKQKSYFKEVIRLHYEKGYGDNHISRILPVSHTTVSRWIGIFALENEEKAVSMQKSKQQRQPSVSVSQDKDIKSLEEEVARLQSQLNRERLRSDAYEEMIKVAETKFNISIRKKAGAKQY
jgi:transposase